MMQLNNVLICLFLQLFGWDLESLWQNANQQQCQALFRAGRIGAAVESYQSTMDKSDEETKARLSAWFTGKSSVTPSNLIILIPNHTQLFSEN